jgi:branched-chain amino acid aminotransferase
MKGKFLPNELKNFHGCFITGTAAEITPVGNILKNKYKVCDLILDLSKAYEKIVGK